MDDQRETGAIEAVLPYVVPGEKAVFDATNRGASYWPVEEHRVVIHDTRAGASGLSLESTGFMLLREQTAVRNFYDQAEVDDIYVPEVRRLVRHLTGAEEVLVFGAIARSDAPGTTDRQLPARGVHVDYDEPCVRDWVRFLAPDRADRLLRRRHILMNLWRPIRTVERSPLALVDASTVEPGDLHPSEVRSDVDGVAFPPMRGYNLSFNPHHRWYYVPRMQPDEVLVFKLCDSDESRVQWTGHTAFDDPTSPPDAAPRESIEVRTISFIPG